jgi:ABC-type transport system involved in cytochrome bd biosynthesis fused ATPase/permease subunit
VIAGLVTPQHGTVVIGGARGQELCWERLRLRVAYLPQRPYLPVGASIREVFRFLLEADDTTCRDALESAGVWRVLTEKNATDPLSTHVDELSAGERQRIAIARILARDADLYLLDEPDANLDRAGIERLIEILHDLAKRATVIVAAHTAEIVAIADHVVSLERGRVVREEHRQEPVTEALHADKRV